MSTHTQHTRSAMNEYTKTRRHFEWWWFLVYLWLLRIYDGPQKYIRPNDSVKWYSTCVCVCLEGGMHGCGKVIGSASHLSTQLDVTYEHIIIIFRRAHTQTMPSQRASSTFGWWRTHLWCANVSKNYHHKTLPPSPSPPITANSHWNQTKSLGNTNQLCAHWWTQHMWHFDITYDPLDSLQFR